MRPVTRRATAIVIAVVVGLLALGAVPSLLGGGPTYQLTVETVDEGPAYELNASDDLSQRQFEYFFSALDRDGASKPYQRGPFGLKESFTHSPFDELDTFRTFAPENATSDDAVFVRFETTRYRVEVTRVG